MKTRFPLLGMLAMLAVASGIACNERVRFDLPTVPHIPNPAIDQGRSLQITGSLIGESGLCMEATILYDGVEIAGARAVCRNAGGCESLELSGDVYSEVGYHTISFKVLKQSAVEVDYAAEGRVLVSRGGLSQLLTIGLGTSYARLRAGESVSFDVEFRN